MGEYCSFSPDWAKVTDGKTSFSSPPPCDSAGSPLSRPKPKDETVRKYKEAQYKAESLNEELNNQREQGRIEKQKYGTSSRGEKIRDLKDRRDVERRK